MPGASADRVPLETVTPPIFGKESRVEKYFFRKGALTMAALYFWHKFGLLIDYFHSNEILDTILLLAINKSPPFDHGHQ